MGYGLWAMGYGLWAIGYGRGYNKGAVSAPLLYPSNPLIVINRD